MVPPPKKGGPAGARPGAVSRPRTGQTLQPPPRKSRKLLLIGVIAVPVLILVVFAVVPSKERQRNPQATPVSVTPPPATPKDSPPKIPPRHSDPEVNVVLLRVDELMRKADYTAALNVCKIEIEAIEASGRSDLETRKLLRSLREKRTDVELTQHEAEKSLRNEARFIADEIDENLQDWKLAIAEQALTANVRLLSLAEMYDDPHHKLEEMKRAASILDPMEGRAGGASLSEADHADLAKLLENEFDAIKDRAQVFVIRDAAQPLLEEGRRLLDQKIALSKKRFGELSAEKKTTEPDPSSNDSDFFRRPRSVTALDPIMERLPDEPSQNKYTQGLDTLRTFDSLDPVHSKGTGLRDLTELKDKLDVFPAFHFYYAISLFFAGDVKAAADHAQRAIDLEPKFGEAWGLRARIAIERSKFEEADQAIDKAESLCPDHPEIYLYRAFLNLYRGKMAAAKSDLQLARKMGPDNPLLLDATKEMGNIIDGPKVHLPYEVKSQNYTVKTDVSQERAQMILDQLEAMRPLYAKVCGEAAKQQAPVPVFMFKNRDEFNDYGHAGENALGYYSPIYRQFVFYEVPVDLEGTLHVLRHEGFHQYVHMVIPNIPRWVNEALAEYTGGSKLEGGKIKEEGFVTPFLKQNRLDQMTDASLDGATLKDMLRNAYDFGPNIGYADGWTLFHFLFKYKGGFYKERARLYIDALRAGKQPREAFAAALPPKEYGGIYSEWKEHFNKLKKKSASSDD